MQERVKIYLRNAIFGCEDSLVSTVGLLSGIAVANVSRDDILIAGIILIFVEAISMAAGSFLSEQTVEEYVDKSDGHGRAAVVGGGVMFVSYFVAGFVPLTPYIFFPVATALSYSIGASIVALFALGFVSARIFHARIWRSGIRMMVVGGLAIAVGSVVGSLFN